MILFSLFTRASRTLAPPQGQASWIRDLRDRLGRFRRGILPTDEELDAEYLGAAGDLHDLEARMRERDRPRLQTRGPFHHHQSLHPVFDSRPTRIEWH